jgi:hypothetical protein
LIRSSIKTHGNFQNWLAFRNSEGFTYNTINILIALIILGIIIYSLIYRGDSHPIPALYTQATGEIPPSKGLSASFSEIVRGNMDEALKLNIYSVRIFAFFALQLLQRVFFSLILMVGKVKASKLAIIDASLSITLFAYCFAPLIKFTFSKIFGLFHSFG